MSNIPTPPVYPKEILDSEYDDDGTIVQNVEDLGKAVIGHKIVSVDTSNADDAPGWRKRALLLTLDNGTKVELFNTDDCCAYTELESFLLHVDKIDHMILGVGTTDKYNTWHIFADFGDVMEMKVGWSCGNPFYYGYGFDIKVVPAKEPS
jgi:hypothetical protein